MKENKDKRKDGEKIAKKTKTEKQEIQVIRSTLFAIALCAFFVSGAFIFADSIKTNRLLAEKANGQNGYQEENGGSNQEADTLHNTEIDKAESLGNTEEAENSAEAAKETKELPVAENVDQVEGEIPEGFYKETLFIGDSRTVGLEEYGHLDGASFFADSGMSVYKLKEFKKKTEEFGEVTIEELLGKKQYKRIYFMIGINELGYNMEKTMVLYEEWVETIQKLQPEAELVICANLHVTAERSNSDLIFNNSNIDILNNAMAKIAESHKLKYIDVNQIFDDESHNMAEAYSNDDSHPIGRYYLKWAVWLANYQSYDSGK